VVDCDPALRSGTGFLFGDATAESFYGGVSRALTAYQNADGFAALRGGICSGRLVLGAVLIAGYGSNG
jgi:glycogen synthase